MQPDSDHVRYMSGAPSVPRRPATNARQPTMSLWEIRDREARRIALQRWFEHHAAHSFCIDTRGRIVIRLWHGRPCLNGSQYRLARMRAAALAARLGAYGSKIGHVVQMPLPPYVHGSKRLGSNAATVRPGRLGR